MPQSPSTSNYAPDIDVDESKKYIVELIAVTEQPSNFRDKRKDAMYDTYKFNMWDQETGEGVIDNKTGELFELWHSCNDLLYDNPTTGKIAPGRELANALCGRRLTDDEVDAMLQQGWEQSLVGKRAVADVEWKTQIDGDRLRIIRLKPYVKKEKAASANTTRRRLLEDDEK